MLAGALALLAPAPVRAASQAAYPVGQLPKYVWIADLNHDGRPDIITANFNSNDISVLLNSGKGVFQLAVSYPVGLNPTSIAVGDFNEDGDADIAVANVLNNCSDCTQSVSILFGNGDGTFRLPAASLSAHGSSAAVVTADLNRDGHLDLVAGDDSQVFVFFGAGDGTFAAPGAYTAGGNTSHNLVVGDFNGDGVPDVASANYTSANVSVLLGAGAGSLFGGVGFSTGQRPHQVIAADVNGDGHPDLISANQAANTVTILMGNGDGTFQHGKSYGAGPNPASVAVGDFNGDGRLDLAIANSGCNAQGVCDYPNSHVSIALNNGDGTFRNGGTYAAGTGSAAIRVGDFNGDSKADLAIGCLGTNSLLVLFGNGDGTFQ